GPWGKPVLERNTSLDRLLVWDIPWFNRRPKQSAITPYQSLAGLTGVLRREQFDVAINFRADFWWGALAARLAGIPTRIGYDAPITRPFLTHMVLLQHGRHAAVENLALIESLVGNGVAARLEFPLTDVDRERASVL